MQSSTKDSPYLSHRLTVDVAPEKRVYAWLSERPDRFVLGRLGDMRWLEGDPRSTCAETLPMKLFQFILRHMTF
jgi:hypothetical protein